MESGKMGKIIGKPVRIDERRRITLPSDVMNILNLREGDYVIFARNEDEVVIRKVKLVVEVPQ